MFDYLLLRYEGECKPGPSWLPQVLSRHQKVHPWIAPADSLERLRRQGQRGPRTIHTRPGRPRAVAF